MDKDDAAYHAIFWLMLRHEIWDQTPMDTQVQVLLVFNVSSAISL